MYSVLATRSSKHGLRVSTLSFSVGSVGPWELEVERVAHDLPWRGGVSGATACFEDAFDGFPPANEAAAGAVC